MLLLTGASNSLALSSFLFFFFNSWCSRRRTRDNKAQIHRLQKDGLVYWDPVLQKQMATGASWGCVTDTQPLGQSKAQSPSCSDKCALRAGSRPLPQSCCWPASCLDGLQLVCSLAGRALILNWLNFTKIRHFGISLKVKQCSLFPTIHCTSLSTHR